MTEHRAGSSVVEHEDRLVTEEPLEVRLGWPGHPATRVWLTMRTPGHDFELAVGWAHHEGLIDGGLVHQVAYCTDATLTREQEVNVVTVDLNGPPLRPLPARHAGLSAGSACGVCGKDSVAEALLTTSRPVWQGASLSPALARTLPAALREHQVAFGRTGGSHGAAIADSTGELLVVREDVGRHNAVDKVTGARLLSGQRPSEAALVVSGRAGFELVQKAVAAGMGALVSIGAPTSLSVSLARESGLTLFGFAGVDRIVQYT